MNATTTKPARPKVDLLTLIDRHNPEQQAIGFAILKARQKRKAAESTARKRGAR